MRRYIIIGLFCLIAVGCEESVVKFIETERGLLRYSRAYCDLGMLISNDGVNIVNEESKPITCSGYIELTRSEARIRGWRG